MEHKGFSIGEVLKFGFEEWKKNWVVWLVISLFALLLPMLPQALIYNLSEDALVPRLLLNLIQIVLSLLVQMGFLTVAIKAAKQQTIAFNDLFSTVHRFPSYVLGKVFYLLSVFFGLLFFIVPGIIVALKFDLWPFFVLDQEKPAIDSLKESNRVIYGFKWDLFFFWIAVFILNALGFLALGVGILVTWPLTMIAWAKVYLNVTEGKS